MSRTIRPVAADGSNQGVLWAALHRFGGVPASPPSGATPGRTRHQFAILPSPGDPRWLVPLGNPRLTIGGLAIYRPFARRARILKNLLVQCARTGWQGWARHRLSLESSGPLALEELVERTTGERRPVFSMSLGTDSRYRKLTVQVMRPGGEILGYIKLPLTPEASARVRHEAAILQSLERIPAVRPHVPGVLFAGPWQEDAHLLFQTAGPPEAGPLVFGEAHRRFLSAVSSVRPVLRAGEDLLDEVTARWRPAAESLEPCWGELGERALASARDRLAAVAVQCGLVHGDFAPWNTRLREGSLFVFDWESARFDAPLIWDCFHFHVQVASLLGRFEKSLSVLGERPANRALLLLYLLDSTALLLREGRTAGDPVTLFRRQLVERNLAAVGKVQA